MSIFTVVLCVSFAVLGAAYYLFVRSPGAGKRAGKKLDSAAREIQHTAHSMKEKASDEAHHLKEGAKKKIQSAAHHIEKKMS